MSRNRELIREIEALRRSNAQDRTDIQRLWRLAQRGEFVQAQPPWGLGSEEPENDIDCRFCQVPTTDLFMSVSVTVSGFGPISSGFYWLNSLVSAGPIPVGIAEPFRNPASGPNTHCLWRIPCSSFTGTDGSFDYQGVGHGFLFCTLTDLYQFALVRFEASQSWSTGSSAPPDILCSSQGIQSNPKDYFNRASGIVAPMFFGSNLPQDGSLQQCEPTLFRWTTTDFFTGRTYRIEVTE